MTAAIGDLVTVDITAVAHGGHCIGRVDGQVVFVRHTLPGERVVARVTEIGAGGKFLRADAVRVIEASADRVPPPCEYAGTCGGCDWQHVALPAQRAMKSTILRELLARTVPAAILDDLHIEEVPGDVDGLRWRTRMRFHVNDDGHLGLLRHRTHEVVPVHDCLIAHDFTDALGRGWAGAAQVLCVRGTPALALPDPEPGRTRVTEGAAGRQWRVDATGFWQVHPGAADALSTCVDDFAAVLPGATALDLYSGVGLFAAGLAAGVGPGGRVVAVEGDERACRDARRNLHDLPRVEIVNADVRRWLGRGGAGAAVRADIAVLDPPRSGAGRDVVMGIARTGVTHVVYVSCEPMTLARDLAYFAAEGLNPSRIRAFDCFPMTHHMETVVLLTRAA